MADLQDVLDALADAAVQILYPGGSGVPSVTGDLVTVYPGWPDASELEYDLQQGRVHVSVYPTDIERNSTRFLSDSEELPPPAPTVLITAATTTGFVLGGVVSVPQNIAVLVDGNKSDQVFSYGVAAGDTLISIAASLAALLTVGGIPATSAGSAVSVPGAKALRVRVGVVGGVLHELRRQARVMQLIIWAATLEQRRAVATTLDLGLAKMRFLTLSDGSAARLTYRSTAHLDKFEKANLFRRDLNYEVEYGTTVTEYATQIVGDVTNISRL